MARGMLTAAEVDEMVADGTLDTILVVFPDLQGRLMGKRVTGHYWVDHMDSGRVPIHVCNYLLAVDSEMTVLPGYEFASWDQGYGDVALHPDLATMRRIPWLEATALVMCDARSEEEIARIVRDLVERGEQLHAVRPVASTLEDAYVEAVGDGPAS